MVYKFFAKKSVGSDIKNEIKQNQPLENELHKPIIKKVEKRKVYSSFKDKIWGVDFADMQLISKYNKGIRFSLCAIDLFSKYAWVVSIKLNVNAFQKLLDNSKRKPNKIWVDQGSDFYNSQFKMLLSDNNIEMCSTYGEGKFVVAEWLIKILKRKTYDI